MAAASTAEDLFGPVTREGAAVRSARRVYRAYANRLHPERGDEGSLEPKRAADAFSKLSSLYESGPRHPPRASGGRPEAARRSASR